MNNLKMHAWNNVRLRNLGLASLGHDGTLFMLHCPFH